MENRLKRGRERERERERNILSLADVNDNCSDWYGKGDSLYVRTDNDTSDLKKGTTVYIYGAKKMV